LAGAIDTGAGRPYVSAPRKWPQAGPQRAHILNASGSRSFVANHKSALKRIRQNKKRQERNTALRSRIRTVVKKFRSAVADGEADAGEKLRAAEREIRKAAAKGLIPARRASRTVSRLAKSLNASSS
jgi:small subunit ribosomal protein S20